MSAQARIRILFCIDTVGTEAGTENQVIEILQRMDRDRFDIFVCCFEDSARLRALAPAVTPVVLALTSLYSWSSLRKMRELRRLLRRERIDIVHTFMVKATIFGVLAAHGSGVRAILTSRRNLGYWYTPVYRLLFRWINAWTTRVVANSEGAKRYAVEIEKLDPGKVDVVYNGVDMRRFAAAQRRRSSGASVVGMVSNYREVKDVPLFLRSAAVVRAKHPETSFLLVGRGPLRESLTRLAKELGLAEVVRFTDGEGEVSEWLSQMDIACLSSASEGFSNAILEYMAAGLPVVARDVGGNAEAVEDGVTGFLVQSREPEDFAAPILRLLEDQQLREEMGGRALERCQRLFSIEGAVRRHESYYERLAGGSAK